VVAAPVNLIMVLAWINVVNVLLPLMLPILLWITVESALVTTLRYPPTPATSAMPLPVTPIALAPPWELPLMIFVESAVEITALAISVVMARSKALRPAIWEPKMVNLDPLVPPPAKVLQAMTLVPLLEVLSVG